MKNVETLAWWLVIIGALNWGLVGAFQINLVDQIFGSMMTIEKLVYILVGLSGVYLLLKQFKLV